MRFFLVLFFITTSAFALEKKSITEYIVAGPDLSIVKLKSTFKNYPPDEMKALQKGNFLLRYKKDPGMAALEKVGGKTLKIQPNFVYKSLK